MVIKKIQAKETYKLRLEVLKTNKDYIYQYQGDFFEKTIHFTAFIKDSIVGIITLMENENPSFSGKQLQLRGMAVKENLQSSGVGSKLIEKVILECKARNADILWCNAREDVIPFYEKSGFTIFGNRFFIKNVGYHYVLFKKLN